MWQARDMVAPYAMREIEITAPLEPIILAPGEGGVHLLVRHEGRPVGRLLLPRRRIGPGIPVRKLRRLAASASRRLLETRMLYDALLEGTRREQPPTPSLTVAVCTRNRATLLRRCLAALVAMRDARLVRDREDDPEASPIEILVVDNAPSDEQTRQAVADFSGVRYVTEPVPGLDFARNRALAETGRDYLGFVDDDAVVDAGWLDQLAEGVEASPEAGAFTGPILPLMLETEAQLRFEHAGGFGEGLDWAIYDAREWGSTTHPAGAGRMGTGASMAFSVAALRAIGGFDEVLDTGPPLPGGGDIDGYYRIVRAGYRIVYLPGLLVHHEHRRDLPGLRKQYHSWGLAAMALLRKNREVDPATRPQHASLLRWYARRNARRLARALLGRGPLHPGMVLAEIWGAAQGYFGEYQRSQRRVAERKRIHQA